VSWRSVTAHQRRLANQHGNRRHRLFWKPEHVIALIESGGMTIAFMVGFGGHMSNPMQNVVSKVAGKAAAAEAHFKGLRGVFTKLAEQHHAVAALLTRLVHTKELKEKNDLWTQIRKELISHEQGELLEVYPVLESYESTRELARRHAEHAGELEDAIAELDVIGPGSDAWGPALSRLIAIVKDHVELEEQVLFPRAEQALGGDVAKQLEASFLRAKAMAEKAFG